MNNDIKEILDKLKECANVNEKFYPAEVLKIGKNNLQKISIYNGHAKILLDYITNLQEKLKVSQTNEETYRLEMQDITKILGLNEHTTFDEVKEYATNLQEKYDRMKENAITLSNGYSELEKENEFLKLNNPEMNMEHFRLIKENKRKIDNLREENKRLKEKLEPLEITNDDELLEAMYGSDKNEK